MTEEKLIKIFIFPTVEGLPPRAALFEGDDTEPANIALWSQDCGCWMIAGIPVQPDMGEVITEHAKSLGVPWPG